MAGLSQYVLGPLADLRRFVAGLGPPPASRLTDAASLAAARARLKAAGCDLTGCTRENLHCATVPLPAGDVYARFLAWEAWPRSGFFPCSNSGPRGEPSFSYRFWGLIPVVRMHTFSTAPGRHIIHAVTRGFGHDGYHCFLFTPAAPGQTDVQIFTVYPPQFFLTGLHDQTNRDIYRKLMRRAEERPQ